MNNRVKTDIEKLGERLTELQDFIREKAKTVLHEHERNELEIIVHFNCVELKTANYSIFCRKTMSMLIYNPKYSLYTNRILEFNELNKEILTFKFKKADNVQFDKSDFIN